jgi:homoserine dehydrogenase
MEKSFKIALAGLGTVGVGVVKLLDANRALIARRAGRPIEIVAVNARDRTRDRGVNLTRFAWADDAASLAARDDVDAVVELIGGADGPALTLARATIAGRKAFVTANKAMIAHHGIELAMAAEAAGSALKFEAAVAGGIPVIKGLREGMAANAVSEVYGILNGTCNYILTRMEAEGSSFADVLSDAQALGYAEADPTFDVDGIDAAHKLTILAGIAFGTRLNFGAVQTSGIRNVSAGDIAQARALGYCIRLIGMADATSGAEASGGAGATGGAGGALYQRVQPCLVPLTHPLSAVKGATNAVVAEGNFVGRLLFEGRGAGEGPTASAVVADLIDIARGEYGPAFAMPVASLATATPADPGARRERSYLRFVVADKPGVLAELTAAMRDGGVSIESMIQTGDAGETGNTDESGVFVAMTTHEGEARTIDAALARLEGSPSVMGKPMRMPILSD